MKTLFEALNANYNWDDIALAISDNDLKNILEGYPKYANKVYPNLKIFYDPSYISHQLEGLKKEEIYITEDELPDNILLSRGINKFKDIYKKSIYKYANESIRDVIDYSKISHLDKDIIDKSIPEYISEYFINYFGLIFLNKERISHHYILGYIDGIEKISYYGYYYKPKKRRYPLEIVGRESVEKKHLIEYGKQATRFFSRSSYKDPKIHLYSGYFDDL